MQDTKKPRVKILFILIDGIGELGIPELQNKTPLQYLDLPYINSLAKTGNIFVKISHFQD
jgi:Predicted phosphoglycerate mutase, AP superfamily